MLYRNPDIAIQPSLLARALRALADLGRARQRRLADLDLMSMNGHLKRDLGLEGVDRLRRGQ